MPVKSVIRMSILALFISLIQACQKKQDLPFEKEIESKSAGSQDNGWTSPDVVMAWSLEFQKAFT
jgi:hypothetical protein